jgi:hypothetical protein
MLRYAQMVEAATDTDLARHRDRRVHRSPGPMVGVELGTGQDTRRPAPIMALVRSSADRP